MPTQVNQELTSRFYDTASATGPFSTSAIYSEAHLSKMILAHTESKTAVAGGKKKKGKKKAPGPDDLLQLNDGVKNREKKKRQQGLLQEICEKFDAADIEL